MVEAKHPTVFSASLAEIESTLQRVEETRVSGSDYAAGIAQLDALDVSPDVLQAGQWDEARLMAELNRAKFGLLSNWFSRSWRLMSAIMPLESAGTLLANRHTHPLLVSLVQESDAQKDLSVTFEMAVELMRDRAQFLVKCAELVGAPELRKQAAELLKTVIAEGDSQISRSQQLAELEAIMQMAEIGESVDSERFLFLAEQVMRHAQQTKNYDRWAAVAWKLFEFGIAQQKVTLIRQGMTELSQATANNQPTTRNKYLLTRLGARVAAWRRSLDFRQMNQQQQTDIRARLGIA